MPFLEALLIAVGLSMDSLAASTAGGVMLRSYKRAYVFKIAFTMAASQAIMMLIGFFVGDTFDHYIHDYDHWIAFLLLSYLGGHMIYEGCVKTNKDNKTFNPVHNKTLLGMAFATSIDAMAVGISMAFLHSSILPLFLTIGVVTFIFSAFGVYFGYNFSNKTRVNFNIIGGIILIGIGLKILIEHLFFH